MINKYVVRCLAAVIAIFLAVGLVEYAHLDSLERHPQLSSAAHTPSTVGAPDLPASHLKNDPRPGSPALTYDPPVTAPPGIKDTSPLPPTLSVPQGAGALGYVVQTGDTLWDLASVHLGNPALWPELFALNQGRHEPDGRVFVNPDLIYPGWTIGFPVGAIGLPSAASAAQLALTSTPGNAATHALALGLLAKGGSQ
jgi:hypothetical protein